MAILFGGAADGTLICHFRQRAHEIRSLHPGLQDISAWVDFTLPRRGLRRPPDIELAGSRTQAYFLSALGIDREMRHLAGTDQIGSRALRTRRGG